MKNSFVTYKNSILGMQESAMAELGWSHGQTITESQVFEGIAANARSFCRDMEMRSDRGEDVPDVESLRKLCGAEGKAQ